MKKLQSNLHSFFQVRISPESSGRKFFIYSQSENKAFFENTPTDTDTFVVSRQGIRLYIRNLYNSPEIPKVYSNAPISLLKSNLQKAVRRGELRIALSTAILIMRKDINELLRRLPIICIEDVSYIESMSAIVWLMMAYPIHIPTNSDMWNILNFVRDLCETEEYYPNDTKESKKYEHDSLIQYSNYNCLLSIYYRSLYGGMPGDIKMLETSIQYYILNPETIIKTKVRNPLSFVIEKRVRIIPEAIDFHCYPKMLTIIQEGLISNVSEDVIKKYIWFCSSAYNIRKKETADKMIELQKDELWKEIVSLLPEVRAQLYNIH